MENYGIPLQKNINKGAWGGSFYCLSVLFMLQINNLHHCLISIFSTDQWKISWPHLLMQRSLLEYIYSCLEQGKGNWKKNSGSTRTRELYFKNLNLFLISFWHSDFLEEFQKCLLVLLWWPLLKMVFCENSIWSGVQSKGKSRLNESIFSN